MMKTGRVLGWALVCILASPVVFAQTNLAVVCSGTTGCANFTGLPASQIFSDIASAIAYVTPISKTTHTTLLITPGTWTLSPDIVIDSTMDLEIIGTSAGSTDDPTSVILQGSAGNNGIELDGALDTVVIEGLTITGAKNGVWAHNGSKGTVARCYIHDNAASGVLVEGSDVFIANCSLKNNKTDGVTVSGAGGTATVYFCTIFQNTEHGVSADAASSGTIVQNCIVYQNGNSGASADAGGIVGVSMTGFATVDTNDSVGNKAGADYLPVGLGTNPVSAVPVFATGSAWGALDGVDVSNINFLIGHAVTVSPPSGKTRFIDVDFENQGRPAVWPIPGGSAGPDIGADEVSTGGGIPQWTYSYVTPNPIPKMTAGTLSVQLRFSGASPTLATGDAIIVPQGTTAAVEFSGATGTPHIPLKVIAPDPVPSGGSSIYFLTNASDITTSLGTAASTLGPSAADTIADGHGVIHVRVGGVEIPTTSIISQATTGRHVLIDTTPPQMYVATPSAAPSFVSYVTPLPSVGPPALPDANHVGLSALPGGRVFVKPSYDDGLILPTPSGGNGAQAFFNPGSISDGYLAANGNPSQANNLNIQVKIAVRDLPPADVTTGAAILGVDEITGLTNRQVAGFGNPAPANKTQESIAQALTGTPGPGGRWVDWVFGAGSLPNTTTVNTTYSAAGGTNIGYDPATGATKDFNDSQLSVAWTFNDPQYVYTPGGSTGIPYTGTDLHMSVQFRVRDAASSATVQTRLLDPLHLWWMLSTRSRIQPNREGTEVAQPDFTWALDRGTNPNAAGQPKPQFTYRIWENLDAPSDYNGLYVPITGWSGWTATNRLTPQDFANLGILASHSDRWLLLTVMGADEAGNVEPWPAGTGLLMNGSGNMAASSSSGSSWQRFYLKGANSNALDTTVSGTFWHDAISSTATLPVLGVNPTFQGPIVPSPQDVTVNRLDVNFTINLIGGENYVADTTHNYARHVRWELVRENDSNKLGGDIIVDDLATRTAHSSGFVVFPSTFVDNTSTQTPVQPFGEPLLGCVFSYNVTTPPPWHLGDSHVSVDARRPVNYVFRAWTYVADGATSTTPVFIDPTPASYKFTVVPSVADYIQNKNNSDFQPVKIQEIK